MNKAVDIVFINPGRPDKVLQKLSSKESAVEPPYITALTASFLRNNDIKVIIIDAYAENLTSTQAATKALSYNPLLIGIPVYGHHPSASTQNMTNTIEIVTALKKIVTSVPVCVSGLHPSALPKQTLLETNADFVIKGESFFGYLNLIKYLQGKYEIEAVKGLYYRTDKKDEVIKINPPEELISDLSILPATAAWDLLPMHLYRAHNWHCFDNINERMPYAAIYTSFGCPFNCEFCCINAPFGRPGIRYRPTDAVIEELILLSRKYNVKNLKIADELFVLSEKHYLPILEGIIKNKLDFNIWVYARIDTMKKEYLPIMRKAGINWIAVGIESGSTAIRKKNRKAVSENSIEDTIKEIQKHEIRVIGNYIFGLPEDTKESLQDTLNLAMKLNCEFANFYCAMAYPGSKLYEKAIKENWHLPDKWEDFSQHGYGTIPLPTKYLSPKEILEFRDNAFITYFSNPKYLEMIESRFGQEVKSYILNMKKVPLKRKLLGNK